MKFHLVPNQIWSEVYLAKLSHVPERSIFNDLIILAGVAQLGVALHSLGSKTDACGLAACWVRGVQIVIALKYHKLTFSLGDVCRERLQDMAEGHLHFCFQLSTSCQTGRQQHFVELPTT